jgi:hypothetical protein
MGSKKIIFPFFIFLAICHQTIEAQAIRVSGKITDPFGRPVVAASVKVINAKQGTSSDTMGVFTINVKANDELIISAIGFADTTVSIGKLRNLMVSLVPKAKALKEVVVSGSNSNSGLPSPEEATREEIITSTFENYLHGAMFSNGIFVSSTYQPGVPGGGIIRTTIPGFGALNTINSGAMLPVVEHKEDTRGSRYLLNRFAKGIIVDQNNNFITDSTNLLNYDKIDGKLMIAQDGGNYLEVDKDKVIAFAFKAFDSTFVFLQVPMLSKTSYFLLVANGPKYSVYKSVKTKFVKDTYVSNGLTESGNPYDEYVDNQVYYWINQKDSTAGILELKKKSIKEAFAGEKEKTESYFSKHKFDDIDDLFIRNLINYLNQ